MMKTEKKENKNLQWIIIAMLGLIVVGLLIYTFSSNSSTELVKEDVSVEIQEQDQAEATPQGSTTFCFRLNGREDMHLPALLGGAGNDVYPNGLSGFNWSLAPQSSGSEPYGILEDGTIFVKKEFLSKWDPNKVEIKADMTGWSPVQMREEEINGEPAYVYK